MKKVLILTLSVFLVLIILGGCGDDGNTVSPSPTATSTGVVNGSVVDQEYNKLPGSFVVAYKIYDSQKISDSQTNYYPTTADQLGNYSLTVPYGLVQFDAWYSQTDHNEGNSPQASWRINVEAGKTQNLDIYMGYFFDPTPSTTTGNLGGRVLENASTMANMFIVVNRVYSSSEIETEQTNMYTGTSDSQGVFFIENIPEGEIEIGAWESREDFENVLDPVYTGQGYIYAGTTLEKDLQYENMAE